MAWDKNKYKDFKVIKLKRRGPKDGQSIDSYLYGKTKGYEEMIFDPKQNLMILKLSMSTKISINKKGNGKTLIKKGRNNNERSII